MKSKALVKQKHRDKLQAHLRSWIKSKYFLPSICYLVLVLVTAIYLQLTPLYRSKFSMVIPGSGSSNNVNLQEIGQVTSSTTTPFNNNRVNPIVNYKEIIKSNEVIKNAADSSGINLQAFGEIKVGSIQQTSIITIATASNSPELAQKKAWALFEAFENKLDRLRADEARRHDESIINVLSQYNKRLDASRQSIVEFQSSSILISHDQLLQQTRLLSELKQQRLQAEADGSQLNNFVKQLSTNLGVSPSLAGLAFKLQTDSQFRGLLRELDNSASQLSEFSSRWGGSHPKVLAAKTRNKKAHGSLRARSHSLIGNYSTEALEVMNLEASPERAALFSTLIDSYAKFQGNDAKINQLKNSEIQMKEILRVLMREASELEKLEREFQLAEAVYSSAAARLEARKIDVFASYPIIQLMATPTTPSTPFSPKPIFAVLIFVLGFILITSGFLIAWQRQNLINILLKKN